MTLKHVETTISESAIRIRMADNSNQDLATEWVDISVPLSAPLGLPNSNGGSDIALGSLATRQFASIQLAVLRYVRDAIAQETQRLGGLART